MKNKLKISIIQSHVFWQNKDKNLSHFENLISKIKATEIILLPEMFNTAFCPHSHNLAENKNGKTVKWMKKVAKEKNTDIAGSLMIKENDKIFNRLIWVTKNGKTAKYDKRHLFSLIKEDKHLSSGTERLIVELDGWKICPLICYDLRFPVFSRNNVDYDVLIYLANWPLQRIDDWKALLKARAIENQSYTIGVNRVGEDGNGAAFNGNSKVFDAFGKEIFTASENKDIILQVEICLNDLERKRKKRRFLQDRDDFNLQ